MTTTLDTSVVVPALLAFHEAHDECDALLAGVGSVPAHVAIEAYSVLTRLPHPLRVPAQIAAETLSQRLPAKVLTLDAKSYRDAPARLARAGLSGGSAYDGLIALTAARHGLELVSRDRRATRTYAALGVPHRLIAA